jgi:hypothetical protein
MSPDKDPARRATIARIAALTRWSQTDSKDAMEHVRAGLDGWFERQVDPDGALDPDERQRRAEAFKKAHYQRMALKSARVRAKKK